MHEIYVVLSQYEEEYHVPDPDVYGLFFSKEEAQKFVKSQANNFLKTRNLQEQNFEFSEKETLIKVGNVRIFTSDNQCDIFEKYRSSSTHFYIKNILKP